MRTTNKFDKNGREIFEGDRVIFPWGWFKWEGKTRTQYQTHIITVNPAHLMVNGQMHDDGGGGIVFCLGRCYNSWKGTDVKKVSSNELIDVPNETNFFYDDTKQPVICTAEHFGLTHLVNIFKDIEYELMFGKKKE